MPTDLLKATPANTWRIYLKTKAMKKLLTLIALSCIYCTGFAQQSFKPIHFTGYNAKRANFSSDKAIKGTIQINLKDSTLIVNDDPVKAFKIIMVAPEQTAVTDNKTTVKWIAFLCTGKDNSSCTIQVARQKPLAGDSLMQVSLTYDDNNVTTYYCDYLNEL
jgi:hypothetical protein